MNKLRLIDAKPKLAAIAGESGMRADDARLIALLNRATEELMNEGDWPGVVDRYRFRVYGGIIVLPGDLNRLVGVAANGEGIELASPWYEFAAAGPGPQESSSWIDAAIDRGETCVLQPIPGNGPAFIEVVGERDERSSGVRPKIILRGYGEDGAWLRSEIDGVLQDGIAVDINGDTNPKLALSAVKLTAIEAVVKPKTKGYVHLYCTIGSTRYHLASYAPSETLPSYRQYFIPHLDPELTHTIVARARRRFVPAEKDGDFLIISNIGALEGMIRALIRLKADDMAGYANHKAVALSLLKKEADAYRGTTRKPAITFSEGASIGYVPYVR